MATSKESADGGNQKKKSKLKWIILIFLFVILSGSGGGGWYYYKHVVLAASAENGEDVPARSAKRTRKDQAPIFVALDPFTVNLRGEDSPLLQITITLQMADEEDATKVKQYLPMVRSRLIMLLTSKRATEILTLDGKNELAKRVAEEVSQPYFPGDYPLQIQNVMFTSFIVQ